MQQFGHSLFEWFSNVYNDTGQRTEQIVMFWLFMYDGNVVIEHCTVAVNSWHKSKLISIHIKEHQINYHKHTRFVDKEKV